MDDIERGADEADAVATDGTMAAWAGLPTEPVDAPTYNAMCEMLGKALDALSGGQIPYEHTDAPGPIEPGQGYPPDKAKAITALKTVLDKVPEGEPHRFAIDEAMATNDGVTDFTAKLDGMARDTKLVRALTAPGVETERSNGKGKAPTVTAPGNRRGPASDVGTPSKPKSKGEAFTKKPAETAK